MKKTLLLILIVPLFLVMTGCAITEVRNVNIPLNLKGATKEQIRSEWGQPYRIYTKPSKLKYGASELWVYRYPDTSSPGVDYYLYFKNGYLIKWDNIIWGL
jgi:hypothetical protein